VRGEKLNDKVFAVIAICFTAAQDAFIMADTSKGVMLLPSAVLMVISLSVAAGAFD
jgi:hypothetical protein